MVGHLLSIIEGIEEMAQNEQVQQIISDLSTTHSITVNSVECEKSAHTDEVIFRFFVDMGSNPDRAISIRSGRNGQLVYEAAMKEIVDAKGKIDAET